MLDYYIRDRLRLAAMERNLLAPFLKEAAEHYHTEGYFYKYARRALGCAVSFGDWLRIHRVPLDRITDDHVARFIDWFAPISPEAGLSRRKTAYSAANFVLALIRVKHPAVITRSFVQKEVARYIDHLRLDRGFAEGTLELHQRDLEQFLTFCFRKRRVDINAITAARIHVYVEKLSSRNKQRTTCAALRGYFQFKQLQGKPTGHLQAVVPTVRSVRPALSPKWLSEIDADSLLRSIDYSQGIGKRNLAVILCMMDLGMRVGDVARLSLDDINWQGGTVRVANHKRARPYRLPLPQRVGQAIADYLANGRPSSKHREIFLRYTHPLGIPATVSSLKTMVRIAWKRAGLDKRYSGTHILRHTVATRMKQEGVSLKSIADVLGHHSMQTTTLYAQVDLPALRKVAQPWPEVQS